MPRPNNDDQFKFLISCIRYSNNGRIDFAKVATECNIVSKGAAAKRYERMMRAHDIDTGSSTVEGGGITPKPRKRKRTVEDDGTADAGASGQVKTTMVNGEDDDDEEDVPIKQVKAKTKAAVDACGRAGASTGAGLDGAGEGYENSGHAGDGAVFVKSEPI